jgi:hypothetical protein
MNGPGRYDEACTQARLATGGHTVVLFVAGGVHGQGFQVQTLDPDFAKSLPAVLRSIADQVEANPPDTERKPK